MFGSDVGAKGILEFVHVGISDYAAAYNEVAELEPHVTKRGQLAGFSTKSLIEPSELLIQKCEVIVPAAVERVITGEDASQLKCRIPAEGANDPATLEADRILHQRGDEIFVLPDMLCNGRGVIGLGSSTVVLGGGWGT